MFKATPLGWVVNLSQKTNSSCFLVPRGRGGRRWCVLLALRVRQRSERPREARAGVHLLTGWPSRRGKWHRSPVTSTAEGLFRIRHVRYLPTFESDIRESRRLWTSTAGWSKSRRTVRYLGCLIRETPTPVLATALTGRFARGDSTTMRIREQRVVHVWTDPLGLRALPSRRQCFIIFSSPRTILALVTRSRE